MAAWTRHTSSLHLLRIHVPSVSFEADKCLLLLLDEQRALTHRCILERDIIRERGTYC